LDITRIVELFLLFRSQLKIFHWNTDSHSRHLAFDELEKTVSDLTDDLIESMIATDHMPSEKENKAVTFKYFTRDYDDVAIGCLDSFTEYLINLKTDLTDAQKNIVDEILSAIEKAEYKLQYLK
jgi:DNA-binding ferritin-like protein